MAPCVYEQMGAIQALGIECKAILVDNGFKGYLNTVSQIRKTIKDFSPDVVHAHYGLCGLVANLQRKIPVVTTYHGTDLHDKQLRIASQLSMILSKRNIVVSEVLTKDLLRPKSVSIIPCGVNADLLTPIEKEKATRGLGWEPGRKHILFSKEFKNKAKNYPLAKSAVDEYNSKYSNGNDTYNNDNEQFVFHSKNRIIDFYAFVIYNQKLCMVNLKNDNIYKSSTFTVQDNKKISIFLHNKNNGKGNYYVLYDGYLYCNPFEDYNASISSLNCDSSQSSPTYSLQGIVIDNPQNGIYISDKKKVVLK